MMQTFVRPSRDLRNHYAEIADMTKNHNHVIITNQGRGESVLINIEDYAKYEEFLHQRYVAEELAKAKQQAADPNTQWQDHDSVWGMLNKEYAGLDGHRAIPFRLLSQDCPARAAGNPGKN